MDFIPSVFLGAPEAGNELSVLPGHRLLMQGSGYEAVRLAVLGGLGALILCVLLVPLMVLLVPVMFEAARPYTHFLLAAIVIILVLTESGLKKRLIAGFVFLLSGMIGMVSMSLPINAALLLFPMLSGFFGISMLVLQLKKKSRVPEQKEKESYVSNATYSRGILSGSMGGILSGLLPGVGTSQIASIMSIEKNSKSFLVSLGAIAVANTIVSLSALWIIGKSRSGVAVAIEQLAEIGSSEFLLILSAAVISAGVSVIISLKTAKVFSAYLGNINYSALSIAVIVFILSMIYAFTGAYGLLLAAVCAALGIFTNLSGVKRGLLMGSLILPTILFYIPA